MGFGHGEFTCSQGAGPERKAALARETVAFAKPVVLVNGDSHFVTEDKLPTDDAGHVILNFTRVMTFGSALNHWVSASIDPDNPEVFTFRQHIVAANVPAISSTDAGT